MDINLEEISPETSHMAVFDSSSFDRHRLLKIYYEEIAEYPLLNHDREVLLAKRIEVAKEVINQGEVQAKAVVNSLSLALGGYRVFNLNEEMAKLQAGQDARDEFINANLRLVVSIARRYQNQGLELADLIQEGNLGLHRAVDKFNWQKGFRFSTYATHWIKQALQRGVYNYSRAIRLPIHHSQIVESLNKRELELVGKLGHWPTTAELAEDMALSPKEIRRLEVDRQLPQYLDQPTIAESRGELTLADKVSDSVNVANEALRPLLTQSIEEMLKDGGISENQRQFLRFYYGFVDGVPHTFAEVAEHCDTSKARVSYLISDGLKKLHDYLTANHIDLETLLAD